MAVPGASVRPGKVVHLVMMGEPVLVGRGRDGKVFALRNICPHRGIPLHHGHFDGETIECAYHGWRFDRAGGCVEVPSMTEEQKIDRSRIRCATYPARERNGIVWVYFARDDEAPSGETAEPPAMPLFAEDEAPTVYVGLPFACSIDHTAYGLMDPAHVAYVHTSRWFRAGPRRLRRKSKAFEPTRLGFKMVQHVVPPSQTFYKVLGKRVTSDITLTLPGLRVEEIHGDRYQVLGVSALTPINDEETMFHQMLWISASWVKPLRPLMQYMSRSFLKQDRDMALKQREGLVFEPKMMLIHDANTQARWWMHLKDEWVAAGREKRPFVNPLKPKTLHWVS